MFQRWARVVEKIAPELGDWLDEYLAFDLQRLNIDETTEFLASDIKICKPNHFVIFFTCR